MTPATQQKLRRLGISIALAIVTVWVLTKLCYRRLLYPAPTVDSTPDAPGTERLALVASDGVPVNALLFPARPGAPTVAYFHGNGEVIGYDQDIAQRLQLAGYGVALVEYRGYGRSANVGTSPTEAGLYADAEAVIAELTRRGVTNDHLVLWGQSLGTGVATEMAARGHGSKMVLVSPFTSIPDAGAHAMPWLPVRSTVADRYASIEKAPSIPLPVMIAHGQIDALVPYAMGVTLAKTFPHAELLTVAGAGHNDVFAVGGPTVVGRLINFIAEPPGS